MRTACFILCCLSAASAASHCAGVAGGENGLVCCRSGCGQTRAQCKDSDDVCHQSVTTREHCCPSAIREAGVECSATQGPPCLLAPVGSFRAPEGGAKDAPPAFVETCDGVVGGPDNTVCCRHGCGQTRMQCSDSDDVCRQSITTKEQCCPSAIKAAAQPCTKARGAPCVSATGEPLAGAKAVARATPHAPGPTSKLAQRLEKRGEGGSAAAKSGYKWSIPEELKHMLFIHVPGTGGSIVEQMLLEAKALHLSVRWQVRDCCSFSGPFVATQKCCWPGPPWHLPPDVFQSTRHRPLEPDGTNRGKHSRWCIVRNPTERYAAPADVEAQRTHGVGAKSTPRDTDQLVALFARGRHNLTYTPLDDELTHLQPQHWFVWGNGGGVQCDCVVAFEKFGPVASRASANKEHVKLPTALHDLYKLDHFLWSNALQSPHLCYTPPSLF